MSEFRKDVIEGLSSIPKRLSSKYFYDQRGDELFIQIMGLEEYYLTRCEFQVLEIYKDELLEEFKKGTERFELMEFGAGDGLKTKILLEHFVKKGTDFKYTPIDISENVLKLLKQDLKREIPELNFEGISGDYFKVLDEMDNDEHSVRHVLLFLGSNIGNFGIERSVDFLKKISSALSPGDLLLIGFDLKKHPQVILDAYNDKEGVTAEFNLNLLHRINRELNGNFKTEQFEHYPTYNPLTGETKSYLISLVNQEVIIDGEKITFQANEPIFMEISQKYGSEDIESMAAASGFEIRRNFLDEKKYYVDSLWEVIG